MPPISFFRSCPNFLSSFATPTDMIRMIGKNCLFLYHCEIIRTTDICIGASILIPTPSRVPKENLALLSAFGFKLACSRFSPLSSRFIFVLALFQSTRTLALSLVPVPLGKSRNGSCSSGRKNVLRKLLRIPYRRLKAGFSVC